MRRRATQRAVRTPQSASSALRVGVWASVPPSLVTCGALPHTTRPLSPASTDAVSVSPDGGHSLEQWGTYQGCPVLATCLGVASWRRANTCQSDADAAVRTLALDWPTLTNFISLRRCFRLLKFYLPAVLMQLVMNILPSDPSSCMPAHTARLLPNRDLLFANINNSVGCFFWV